MGSRDVLSRSGCTPACREPSRCCRVLPCSPLRCANKSSPFPSPLLQVFWGNAGRECQSVGITVLAPACKHQTVSTGGRGSRAVLRALLPPAAAAAGHTPARELVPAAWCAHLLQALNPSSNFSGYFVSLTHFAAGLKKKKIPATSTAKCKNLDVLKMPPWDNFPWLRRKLTETKRKLPESLGRAGSDPARGDAEQEVMLSTRRC